MKKPPIRLLLCAVLIASLSTVPASARTCVPFQGIDHCPVGEAVLERTDAGLAVHPRSRDISDGVVSRFATTIHWHAKTIQAEGADRSRELVSISDGAATSRLFIDDKVVVDHDGLHGSTEMEGKVELTKGRHKLFVEHFENGGGEQLTLNWRPPGAESFVLVPNEVLRAPKGEVRVTSPGNKKIVKLVPRYAPGDGGPLDGVYQGAAEIEPVWRKFTKAQGPLKVAVSDLQEDANPAGATVSATVKFASAKTIPVFYVLTYRGDRIVNEVWQISPAAAKR